MTNGCLPSKNPQGMPSRVWGQTKRGAQLPLPQLLPKHPTAIGKTNNRQDGNSSFTTFFNFLFLQMETRICNFNVTLPKTNVAPKNCGFQEESPFPGDPYLQGCVGFREGLPDCLPMPDVGASTSHQPTSQRADGHTIFRGSAGPQPAHEEEEQISTAVIRWSTPNIQSWWDVSSNLCNPPGISSYIQVLVPYRIG